LKCYFIIVSSHAGQPLVKSGPGALYPSLPDSTL
jgi:hypothetical protein